MRVAIRVAGVVQGVGFRPFVHRLARQYGLGGFVGNDVHGVFAEAEGEPRAVEAFINALKSQAPPLAVVDDVETREIPAGGEDWPSGSSRVQTGEPPTRSSPPIPPPVTTACANSATPPTGATGTPSSTAPTAARGSPSSRGVPYDRPLTTMAGFAMCADCKQEYEDPADRRFHAQPVCCPACGPTLRFEPGGGDPIHEAAAAINQGAIVAVKGLGRLSPRRRGKARRSREEPAGEEAPGGQALRRHGRRPRAGPGARRSRRGGRTSAQQQAAAHRAPAENRRTSRTPSRPGTGGSGSCCPTPRCTTCCWS